MSNFVLTCTNCQKNFTKSLNKCPYCGRKLMNFDLNQLPLERQPDYNFYLPDKISRVQDSKESIDYTKFFNKNNFN